MMLILTIAVSPTHGETNNAAVANAASQTEIHFDLEKLPKKTRETLNRIKAAAQSGDIEELRSAMEWNELPPEFGGDEKINPIDHWKKISADGSARDIMAIMLDIFDRGYVIRQDESGVKTYIWPYLAEKSLKKLSPPEQVDLHRLAEPDQAKSMQISGIYAGYWAVIGEDGTWHSFVRKK